MSLGRGSNRLTVSNPCCNRVFGHYAVAFATAATVSLLLVCGYLWRAHGKGLARVAFLAQFAYMVLFSASFFFDGLTGITITVGAIVTLAILMMVTAKVDWKAVFQPKPPVEGEPQAT